MDPLNVSITKDKLNGKKCKKPNIIKCTPLTHTFMQHCNTVKMREMVVGGGVVVYFSKVLFNVSLHPKQVNLISPTE